MFKDESIFSTLSHTATFPASYILSHESFNLNVCLQPIMVGSRYHQNTLTPYGSPICFPVYWTWNRSLHNLEIPLLSEGWLLLLTFPYPLTNSLPCNYLPSHLTVPLIANYFFKICINWGLGHTQQQSSLKELKKCETCLCRHPTGFSQICDVYQSIS